MSTERALRPPSELVAYALAWAGGAVAYTPFLTLLLPLRFTQLSGTADIYWLGLSTTIGAVAASLGNILWGLLSDRVGIRLPLSAAGIVAIGLSSIAIARSDDPGHLIAAVALWQLSVNLFLAPLAAFAADNVPTAQKGVLGGLLAMGPGVAALSIVSVSLAPAVLALQLGLILLFVLLCSLPLFVGVRGTVRGGEAVADSGQGGSRRSLVQLWMARLIVQVAEGLLFVFLFYFLRSLTGDRLGPGQFAATNAAAQLCALPVALLVGRRSDQTGRRRGALLAMVTMVAVGLGGMAMAPSLTPAILCYILFVVGSTSFLALHTAFAMQQLRDPRHYGRDLGLFNLTNTLPALITPMIAAMVIGQFGYSWLMAVLALAMLVPVLLIARLDLR